RQRGPGAVLPIGGVRRRTEDRGQRTEEPERRSWIIVVCHQSSVVCLREERDLFFLRHCFERGQGIIWHGAGHWLYACSYGSSRGLRHRCSNGGKALFRYRYRCCWSG